MLELGLKFTLAYLLGSILGSLVVGQLYGGVDIRQLGSGNAGGTNALRTQGKVFALWVIVIDVGKGILPVIVLPTVDVPGVGIDPLLSREFIAYAVGFAALLGHVYPLWYDFRGGKGGATAAGVLCVVAPSLALPVILFWVAAIILTGYVGLSTIAAVVGAAVYIGITDLPDAYRLFVLATLIAVLIIFTHRANIVRMWQGTENRMHLFRSG
ncbi:MAG: glycerol-3-phosphate 1-O-acyltransferase PlsY [Gammaproteobacteria bacterium]|nr:glycerol-3-phosphate 1-O-acyltransferase PlsY [Gammaproteobacteria bacterium]MCZ6497728.1 glycerol-3-phosphate 1-O-acyltransferase PlsY [Gammaproteobacteria bacterium]MCZ6585934.1 glycerol-3-phosphate 1-O-acyltransferase PlsY [Gammaproteobacteria bacterium]